MNSLSQQSFNPILLLQGSKSFFDRALPELENEIIDMGERKYRGIQLYKWVYNKNNLDVDSYTDISKDFKQKFKETYFFQLPRIVSSHQSVDGSYKLVHELDDKKMIETVLMKHDGYFTICVSSQVGCAMACAFCVTGTMGLKRNLKAAEIIAQVVNARLFLADREEYPLRNIVFMGMGEPFHNYDQVSKSLNILLDPNGMDFSGRRVTVSTSGLTDKVERFLSEHSGVNLAISLNHVTQEERKKIMPISGKFPLDKLMRTCREMGASLKRRITFEYIMLKDCNDSIGDAVKLVKLVNGIKAKINLIPYNVNPGLPFQTSTHEKIEGFKNYLLGKGLVATIRYSKGQDINAACGQLVKLKKTINE